MAARATHDQLPVLAFSYLHGGFAQTLQAPGLGISRGKEGIEAFCQFLHNRTGHAQTEIAPAVLDAIAFVFISNVESADEGDPVIDDKHLSMVAIAPALEGNRIKPGKLAADFQQWIPERCGETDR